MIMVGANVLVVILAIGGYMTFHHPSPAGGGAPAEETQLETDAKALQGKGDLQGALGKWQELAAKKGVLKDEAEKAVTEISQEIQQQEKTLFDQAKADQDAKKWDEAVALYKKAADMNGPMKDQALQAITIVASLQHGTGISKVEKGTFQQATLALQKRQYSQAQGLFQQVIALKVPDSTLAPQAQKQLASIEPILQAKAEFDAAVGAQNKGDLQGALAQFKAIAGKPGPMKSEAKQRLQQVSDQTILMAELQEFDAADQAQKNGDLKGGLAQFRALAAKPGPMQAQAQARLDQITAELRMPPPPPAAAAPTPTPTAAHNPVVTPLYSGDLRPLTLPYHKGMTVADVNVDGGLKATNLAMPAVQGALPGTFVIIMIKIDENGSVTPDHVMADTSGFGPQVQEAARAWNFNSPTAKGKPVNATLTVKVTF